MKTIFSTLENVLKSNKGKHMERSVTMLISCQGVCLPASYESYTIECIFMSVL